MCELFGLSCNAKDRATISLPVFGDYSKLNRDGWGIAYYRNNRDAIVKKRPEKARKSEMFQEVITEARSNIIIAHLRFATSGRICQENCHPFLLKYINRDWVFAHNGSIPGIDNPNSPKYYESRTDGDNDSARVFTFMMDKIKEYQNQGRIRGIYPAIKSSIKQVFNNYGTNIKFNFLLSEGINLYVFNHHPRRPIYFLRREKDYGGAILISTQKLSHEDWITIPEDRLLVLSRGEVLVLSDRL